MNWLEKCDPRHSLDVTGWDQLYQALPQHEKHLNNLSNVKLLILKVNTISIYLKPWIISNNKKRGNYITNIHNKYDTSTHLRQGIYTFFWSQKFEFLKYLKIRDFLEEK